MRMRTIKPELWDQDAFKKLSIGAKLLWIWLQNYADDYGMFLDSIGDIESSIKLGGDNINRRQIKKWLREFHDLAMIARFEYGSRNLCYICKWNEMQKVNHKSKPKFIHKSDIKYVMNSLIGECDKGCFEG